MIRTIRALSFPALLLALLGTPSLSSAAAASGSQSCRSISTVYFHSSSIDNVKFTAGRGCTSDIAAIPDRCDWVHTISRDQVLRTDTGKEVRLVVVHTNQESGSGAWDNVFVFDCVDGSIRKVLERKDLAHLKIENTAGGEIVLVTGVWQPSDPPCCPSQEKREVYRWNPDTGAYEIKTEAAEKPEKKTKTATTRKEARLHH